MNRSFKCRDGVGSRATQESALQIKSTLQIGIESLRTFRGSRRYPLSHIRRQVNAAMFGNGQSKVVWHTQNVGPVPHVVGPCQQGPTRRRFGQTSQDDQFSFAPVNASLDQQWDFG